MKEATRIGNLTSAIFTEMNEKKEQIAKTGLEIIDLGIGSPDLPPAPFIKEALIAAVSQDEFFGYPTSEGSLEFRTAVSEWYKERFDVTLCPKTEVLTLMGSQDGLAHIALAYIDKGDYALVPDPGYPIYSASIMLAEGQVFPIPLLKENNFLPDLTAIPSEIAQKAKLMVLNYPNNPVAAVAGKEFFQEVVSFAQRNDILICHDAAYSELAFDGFKPTSLLEIPGAKEIGLEFHSLSKTFNMAGCRIGFVVGNSSALKSLAKIKSNIDYGVFKAIQQAGIAALKGGSDYIRQYARAYERRRDILVDGLAEFGWEIPKPKGSMFLWAPLPLGFVSSKEFAFYLLEKTGVVVIPGVAFGKEGEGYVRIALVKEEQVLQEVIEKIGYIFS